MKSNASAIEPGLLKEPSALPAHLYHKGTLFYTKRGLVMLFIFLLWGDCTLLLMEMVIPNILPLQLKDLGASNVTMSLLLTSTPALFGLTVNPFISLRSDNYRSRWGRRRPFLSATA